MPSVVHCAPILWALQPTPAAWLVHALRAHPFGDAVPWDLEEAIQCPFPAPGPLLACRPEMLPRQWSLVLLTLCLVGHEVPLRSMAVRTPAAKSPEVVAEYGSHRPRVVWRYSDPRHPLIEIGSLLIATAVIWPWVHESAGLPVMPVFLDESIPVITGQLITAENGANGSRANSAGISAENISGVTLPEKNRHNRQAVRVRLNVASRVVPSGFSH